MARYTVIGLDAGMLANAGDAWHASWVEVVTAPRPSLAAVKARKLRAPAAPATQTVVAVFCGAQDDVYERVADPLIRRAMKGGGT